MDKQSVAKALEALVAAARPEDALGLLRDQGEAFSSPFALELFDANIARSEDDPDLKLLLQNRRLIVSEYQRAGLDAAAAVMRGEPGLADTLDDWLRTDGWDAAFRFLEAHQKQLLSADALALADEAAQRYADDPHGGPKINAYRALMAIARDAGLVEARRWLCGQLIAQVQNPDAPMPLAKQAAYYQVLVNLTDPATESNAWAAVNINYGSVLRGLDRPRDAVERFEAALEVLSAESTPEHYAGTHRSLGNIYAGSELADPDKAIFHFTEALKGTTLESDPANFLHIHHMLGTAWRQGGQRAEALAHFRQAVAVDPRHNPDQWAQAAADLANELSDDFGPTRQQSLGEAIDLIEAALAHLDPGRQTDRRARSLRNLGMAYRDIDSMDRAACLDRAVSYTNEALALWTREADAYHWAQLQHNLGTIYYLHPGGDTLDNLNQAAAHYRQALTVHTREDHPDDWALTEGAIAMVLIRRADLADDPAPLDEAIEHASLALDWWRGDGDDGTPRTGSYRAEAHNALGGALVERARAGRQQDLDEAIGHLESARDLYAALELSDRRRAVDMNLAGAYEALAVSDPAAFPRALDSARRALKDTSRETDPYTWAIFQRNLAALLAGSRDPARRPEVLGALNAALDVFTADRFPIEHCETLGFVGHVHFERRAWQSALDAYVRAIDATGDVLGTAYTESGRRYRISKTSLFFMRAAWCLVELDRAGEALVMLDSGKGRALSMHLSVRAALARADSGGQDGALAQAQLALARLEAEMRLPVTDAARRSDAELGRALRSARSRLRERLDARTAGTPADLSLDQILANAPAGGALVSLLVTTEGAVAFVVPAGTRTIEARHLVRSSFSTEQLHQLLLGDAADPGLLRAYLSIKLAVEPAARQAAQAAYGDRLLLSCARLWHELMAAVAARLADLSLPAAAPLCLLPQGGLGMLPLHAVCNDQVAPEQPGFWPLLERYAVSYAPSVYALAAARRSLADSEEHDAGRSLFAVIDPAGDLGFARIEGALAADFFRRSDHAGGAVVLDGDRARLASVREAMNDHRYLHFACHGAFSFADADRSALQLSRGETLTLSELMGPRYDFARNRLVTLSACETGMVDVRRSPDEYLGLPTAFLRAGAPAVLATLWEVNDLASAILVAEFYRRHLVVGESPAAALRNAQRMLVNATAGDILSWLRTAAITLRARIDAGEKGLTNSLRTLEQLSDRIDGRAQAARPYFHPWYWAGFTLTGL